MARLIMVVTAVVACLGTSALAAQYKIMIVTWRGCEEACQGFQDYLQERTIDAEFILRDAEQKKQTLPGFRAEARAEKVNLVVTWGTSVTRGIAGTLADRNNSDFLHDIPRVFMIVADPVGAGIVESLDRTGRRNVTGTYNRVPETVNIETVRAYRPNFKRLGLLYNTNEKNSVLKRNEMAGLTGKMRFELIDVALRIGEDGKPQVTDIPLKMAALKRKKIDFLYLGSSSFLRKNRDVVTRAALENGIPVLSPYERLVRESKALISVAARYYEVGRLAGSQAQKILIDGAVPGDLPVARMTNFAVVINMNVAKTLKLFPPLDLLQVAETVK